MRDIDSHGMTTNNIANVTLGLFEIEYNFTMVYFTSLIIDYRLGYATLQICLPNATCLVRAVGVIAPQVT